MPRNVQRVLAAAQSLPAEKFWSDLHHTLVRRKDPRVHANVPLCVSLPGGASVSLRSNDLSFHGLQVHCDRRTAAALRPRRHARDAQALYPMSLELDIAGRTFRVNAHARIAHVTLIADAPPAAEVAVGMIFVSFEDGARQALHRFIEQHMLPAGPIY